MRIEAAGTEFAFSRRDGKQEISAEEPHVNTDCRQFREGSPPSAPGEERGACGKRKEEETGILLARVAGDAGFFQVIPRLRAVLEQDDPPGSTICETLAGNIRSLQDVFMQALYALLSAHSIDANHKVTLRLEDAVLVPTGEHPDKERIRAALAGRTDLSAAFADLAAQSAALRDLTSLSRMIRSRLHSDASTTPRFLPGEPAYQLSLKGDMNHFHFCR